MAKRSIASKAKQRAIEVRSISDRLTDAVRDMILSGALKAGDPIPQGTLAAEFSVSKIPLREALSRLEQQGLVESYPNRGYFVSRLQASEAEELYALRLRLEPEATSRAAVLAGKAHHLEAERALTRLEADVMGERNYVGTLNREFHMSLLSPLQETLTYDIISKLNVLSDRYVRKHLEPSGRGSRADKEHRTILSAWKNGDVEKVELLLSAHIQSTLDDLRLELHSEVQTRVST